MQRRGAGYVPCKDCGDAFYAAHGAMARCRRCEFAGLTFRDSRAEEPREFYTTDTLDANEYWRRGQWASDFQENAIRALEDS